jgi:hypothetical protein
VGEDGPVVEGGVCVGAWDCGAKRGSCLVTTEALWGHSRMQLEQEQSQMGRGRGTEGLRGDED